MWLPATVQAPGMAGTLRCFHTGALSTRMTVVPGFLVEFCRPYNLSRSGLALTRKPLSILGNALGPRDVVYIKTIFHTPKFALPLTKLPMVSHTQALLDPCGSQPIAFLLPKHQIAAMSDNTDAAIGKCQHQRRGSRDHLPNPYLVDSYS